MQVQHHWSNFGSYNQREQGRALEEIDRLLAQLESIHPSKLSILVDLYHYRSLMRRRYGNHRGGLQDLQKSIELSIQLGDHFAPQRNAGNLALIYWSMYKFQEAVDAFQERIAWCEAKNDLVYLARSVGYLGLVYISQGKLTPAERAFKRQISLAERIQCQNEVENAQINLASVHIGLKQYAQAADLIKKWFSSPRVQDEQVAIEKLNLSICYAGLGQPESAQQLAQEAWQIAQQQKSTFVQALALRRLADHQPSTERIETLHKALSLARSSGKRLVEADCLLALAHTSVHARQRADWWKQGVQVLKEIEALEWVKGTSPALPPSFPATWR